MKNKKSGFTLIELVVVMLVFATLAAIVIPAFTGYIDKEKKSQCDGEKMILTTAITSLYDSAYFSSDTAEIKSAETLDQYLRGDAGNGQSRIAANCEGAVPADATQGVLHFRGLCPKGGELYLKSVTFTRYGVGISFNVYCSVHDEGMEDEELEGSQGTGGGTDTEPKPSNPIEPQPGTEPSNPSKPPIETEIDGDGKITLKIDGISVPVKEYPERNEWGGLKNDDSLKQGDVFWYKDESEKIHLYVNLSNKCEWIPEDPNEFSNGEFCEIRDDCTIFNEKSGSPLRNISRGDIYRYSDNTVFIRAWDSEWGNPPLQDSNWQKLNCSLPQTN